MTKKPKPFEVSFFINNKCNLNCRHCYVGSNFSDNNLGLNEYKRIVDEAVSLGARTFGIVGREPLLTWDENTHGLLRKLQKIREGFEGKPKIRFGIVTNATLLDYGKIKSLNSILPDYFDISLDGMEESHDYIRGKGTFKKLDNSLGVIASNFPKLMKKVVVSFTLMSSNKKDLPEVIYYANKKRVKRFLISPYVKPIKKEDLGLPDGKVLGLYSEILDNKLVDFGRLNNLELMLGADPDVHPFLWETVSNSIVDFRRLQVDDYGNFFNTWERENGCSITVKHDAYENTYIDAVRISHDGYVSGTKGFLCTDLKSSSLGNVRKKSLKEILQR